MNYLAVRGHGDALNVFLSDKTRDELKVMMAETPENSLYCDGIEHYGITYKYPNGSQILLRITGEGWYQEEGKLAQSLKPGVVVSIPANVKHWHGAKKDSWFSHVAFKALDTEWYKPVSNEEYNVL